MAITRLIVVVVVVVVVRGEEDLILPLFIKLERDRGGEGVCESVVGCVSLNGRTCKSL